jgi:hypothetical protein
MEIELKRIKKETVKDFDEFIEYITIEAILNVAKYSNYKLEDIFEHNNLEYYLHKICISFDTDFYRKQNVSFFQNQLNKFNTHHIRRVEYDIYFII